MTAPFKDYNPFPVYDRHHMVVGWSWRDETSQCCGRIYETSGEALRALLLYQTMLNHGRLSVWYRIRDLFTRLWRDESTLPRR